MAKRRLQVERPIWRHALETSALAAAGMFVLAASRVPAFPAVLGAVACSIAVWSAVVITTGRGALGWYIAAWAVVLDGWLIYARITSPWTMTAWLALGVPVVFLAPAGAVAVAHWRAAGTDVALMEAQRQRREWLAGWHTLFANAGMEGVLVKDATTGRAGIEVHLALAAPMTFDRLNRPENCAAVETAKHWRRGAVRFDPGTHAGDAWMRVSTRNVLAEEVAFPHEITPLSITKPFGIGLLENGETLEILMREVRQLIVGVTGSGKSNLMHVEIAQLARMGDAVKFMIDMKGGRVARQWILPWVENGDTVRRPVIDWIACTRTEVELMLRAILDGIDYRQHNLPGEKVKPTRKRPAVVLIIDELAVVFGDGGPTAAEGTTNRVLARLGTDIASTGRSEAFDLIGATQRGTVTMAGGGDFMSQCKLRIGLAVTERADAARVIPDDVAAQRILANIHEPGAGVVSKGGRNAAPAPVKFYRLDPDLDPSPITRIATITGPWQPALDEGTANAMGAAYAERWERNADVIRQWRGDPPLAQLAPPPAEPDPAGTGPRGTVATVMPPAPVAETPEDMEALFASSPDDPDPRDPARRAMITILEDRGLLGYTPGMLRARLAELGHTPARETVQRWLAAEERAGSVRRRGGGVWVARSAGGPAGGS